MRLAAARVAATLLLSLALAVTATAQKSSPDSAIPTVASAKAARLPVLEEATDDGDDNLPAPGQSYLQPTIFRPAFFIPAPKRSVSQTTESSIKDLKLYLLKGVLLI